MTSHKRMLAAAFLALLVAGCTSNGSQIIEAGQTQFFEDEPTGKIEFQGASQGQVWIIDRGQKDVMGATVADFDGKILGKPSIVSYIGDPDGENVILNRLEGGSGEPTTMAIGLNWLWSHKVGARDGAGNPVLWEWDNAWHIEQVNHRTGEVWVYRKTPGFDDSHYRSNVVAKMADAGDYVGFEVRNESNATVKLILGVGPEPSDATKRAAEMLKDLK